MKHFFGKFIFLSAALLCSTTGHAEIFILGNPPPFVRSYLELLGTKADTKGPLTIMFQPCGQVNAAYSNDQIVVCNEIIVKALDQSMQLGGSRAAAEKFRDGQILRPILHEIAHALIHRHNIAFSGREEDTCDQFAAWLIMRQNNGPMYVGAVSAFIEPPKVIQFFKNSQLIRNSALTDEHALDKQRLSQFICWGYGRDPSRFQAIAMKEGMSPQRLGRCETEYEQLMGNTPKIFSQALSLPK